MAHEKCVVRDNVMSKSFLPSLFIIIFTFLFGKCFCQDTTYIKVLFLYGSKPAKGYEKTERKWFGGMLGGHAGIEVEEDSVLSFFPYGKFHWFAKKNNRHSRYRVHTEEQFWHIFRTGEDSVKKAVVIIPINNMQKYLLDSIKQAYLQQTPYDYALFGMRCGAASYEVLAKLGILKKHSYHNTFMKIFYPKKLRRRLFKMANKNGWTILRQDGNHKRKWEKD